MNEEVKNVFISYSHDNENNENHKEWVLTLADKLIRSGINVIFDQWDLPLGGNLSKFMEQGLTNADRVLVICTENYINKSNISIGGAGYEKTILTAQLIQDQDTKKFIPIVRNVNFVCKTPICLTGRVYIDFSDDQNYEDTLEKLLRELHQVPLKKKPEIGQNPFKAPSSKEDIDTTPTYNKVDLTGIDGVGEDYSDVIAYINTHNVKYFYPEDLIKLFLFAHNFEEKKGNTKFIKYDNAYKYYSGDRTVFVLVNGKDSKSVEVPYKEEINFIKNPETLMIVEGNISPYKMSEEIRLLTEGNLSSYREENSGTKDDPILRIASLKQLEKYKYTCKLESSSYYNQVRTNLTLDYLLNDPSKKYHGETLRSLDLSEDGILVDFNKSRMVNSIGVSAVLYYHDPDFGKTAFFLKPRKGARVEAKNKKPEIGVGVFQNMLGIISGVVKIPNSGNISDIVQYIESEIYDELKEEAGYTRDQKILMIKPLAFVRELARGGKPQFFFLIEVPYIKDSDFRKQFRQSSEGRQEFRDGKKRLKFESILSPEAAANLLYALSYFENKQKLS